MLQAPRIEGGDAGMKLTYTEESQVFLKCSAGHSSCLNEHAYTVNVIQGYSRCDPVVSLARCAVSKVTNREKT